jgi:hypothetical protein
MKQVWALGMQTLPQGLSTMRWHLGGGGGWRGGAALPVVAKANAATAARIIKRIGSLPEGPQTGAEPPPRLDLWTVWNKRGTTYCAVP